MKVIRHHNYPNAMESEMTINNKSVDLFSFCVFELNNGRTISLHTMEMYNIHTISTVWKYTISMEIQNLYYFPTMDFKKKFQLGRLWSRLNYSMKQNGEPYLSQTMSQSVGLRPTVSLLSSTDSLQTKLAIILIKF